MAIRLTLKQYRKEGRKEGRKVATWMEAFQAATFLHCFQVNLAALAMLLNQQTHRTKETPYKYSVFTNEWCSFKS